MMTRQESILCYVSMAGTDLSYKELSRKQAIEKVYFLCRNEGIKVTRKTLTVLIDLQIKANNSLKSKTPEKSCNYLKEQKRYFFYNPKV